MSVATTFALLISSTRTSTGEFDNTSSGGAIVERNVRSSTSAAIETCAFPFVNSAHAARSHIHAGISREIAPSLSM
jgi:hypothetical protein